MSEKTLKLILGGVAGVVIVYLLAGLVVRVSSGASASELAQMSNALQEALQGELQAIVIESPYGHVEVVPGGPSGWTVNGYRADAAAVAAIDGALASARVAHLASNNPANHGRMGVADDSSWSVELRRSAGSKRLIVGTAGPNYPSSYVRLPGQNEVFVVNGDLGHALRRGVSDWRDRKIAAIDTARAVLVSVSRPEGRYTIARSVDHWRMGSDGTDARMVHDILEQLNRFDAQDFPPDTAQLGPVVRSVVALNERGDTLTHIRLSRPDDYSYRASVRGDPLIYEVASWRVERMTPEGTRVIRPVVPQ
jgi:hypothetical protein